MNTVALALYPGSLNPDTINLFIILLIGLILILLTEILFYTKK